MHQPTNVQNSFKAVQVVWYDDCIVPQSARSGAAAVAPPLAAVAGGERGT